MRLLCTLLVILFIPAVSWCQLINNYDTCRTQVYYQIIGNSNNDTKIVKARTVQDHGVLGVGYLKQGTNQDALIIKHDKDGRVIWQKIFGDANHDELCTDWREMTDRKLLVTGVAKNKTSLQSHMFIMMLSPDGTIIWQKSYSDISPSSSITNARIYPDINNENFFVAESDSAIIYGMTNSTGSVNWQKSISVNPGTKLVAASAEFNFLMFATNTVDSGYHVSNIYYVNYNSLGHPQTIRFTTRMGGPNQNAHYILHDFEQYDIYSYFSGIRSINNGPYELVRVNIKSGYWREALETISTPGIAIDSLSRSAISIYGDYISFTNQNISNKVYSIKMTGSMNDPTYTIFSASNQLPGNITLTGNARTWDNGYIINGQRSTPGGGRQIVQLKLDSVANAGQCIARQTEALATIRQIFPEDTVRYTYTILHGLTPSVYSMNISSAPIDTSFYCKEIYCPTIPDTDSCVNSFQKLYRTYEENSTIGDAQIINGRIYLMGSIASMDYLPERSYTYVAEFTKNGMVKNQRKYYVGVGVGTRMHKGNDSTLLLYGTTSDSAYFPSIVLAKIDTNLNLRWIKTHRLTTTAQYAGTLTIGSIHEASDGGYFLLYSDFVVFTETRVYLTKLDANGNFMWSKIYRITDPGRSNYIKGVDIVVSNGYIYISCKNGYNSYKADFLLKATEANGSLIWSKRYANPNEESNLLSDLLHIHNNTLYMAGLYKDPTSGIIKNLVVTLDTAGLIMQKFSFRNSSDNIYPRLNFQYKNQGKFLVNAGSSWLNNSVRPYQFYMSMDDNLNILRARKRNTLFNNAATSMTMEPNGQLYESGYYYTSSYSGQAYFIKFSPEGNVGTCPSDSFPILKESASAVINMFPGVCVQTDTVFTMRTPVYRVEQSYLATSDIVCASVPGCDTIHLTGDTLVCNQAQAITYQANRNSGCEAPLQWSIDQSQSVVQILAQTDSTITLSFSGTGNVQLKARLSSNCRIFSDSLLIRIIGASPTLDLGPDTSLCPGSSLLLNAGAGFMSYRWQNGSSNQTFTVTSGGTYYVTVTDSCGNIQSDSILVNMGSGGPVLNLGPDSSFCQSNSILLQAQPGFLSYNWQDGSGNMQFIATTPGIYFVSVTDSCGNIISDTIRIRAFRQASTLNLGRDTSFCSSVNVRLSAGTGFAEYRWQDGSTDSVFTANTTGLFFVQVRDSCGNTMRDSIRIYPDTAIVFDMGPDRFICRGDSVTLQATPGLSNYSWSPQATIIQQTTPYSVIVIPQSNTWYHVSAIKPNGCTVTDSVFVTVNVPPPINLGADTSLCQGDTLLLNAGPGFQSYEWSTGQQGSTIGVYQAGTYILSALDQHQCSSADTISILQMYPLPVSQLLDETSICKDQPLNLHAGSGYPSYYWNTGESTESISVTSMGYYWVTITNASGCKATDTIHVNREYEGPGDLFNVKDSTICSFESITLGPSASYQSYLWSNGSSNSFIRVGSAGEYWLQVEDIHGCKGTDTFKLKTKDCNIGIYFPSSFTPNDDGLNDTYGPKAYGNLVSYRMAIYNRYGEKIFETYNIRDRWNGKYKGYKQEIGAYVWESVYQMAGKPLVRASGTLLLIR